MRRFILAALIGLSVLSAEQSSEARKRASSSRAVALPERKRALTITGPSEPLNKAMKSLSSRPHSWEASPIKRDIDTASVRLRWRHRPSYRDLGGIIYVAQLNGFQISDTDLLEQ